MTSYVLNALDGKRASSSTFKSKQDAKVERNRLSREGVICVVSRGPDHPHGPSSPDPRCQNVERTAIKRVRRERSTAAA